MDDLGTLIDRLDSFVNALQLPIKDDLHVKILRDSLPELVTSFKAAYVAELHENPWE